MTYQDLLPVGATLPAWRMRQRLRWGNSQYTMKWKPSYSPLVSYIIPMLIAMATPNFSRLVMRRFHSNTQGHRASTTSMAPEYPMVLPSQPDRSWSREKRPGEGNLPADH